MSNMTRRRSISGVFIFDKYPDEEKRSPTVFEDCQPETQDVWLNSLEPEALKNLAKMLASSIRKLGDVMEEEGFVFNVKEKQE